MENDKPSPGEFRHAGGSSSCETNWNGQRVTFSAVFPFEILSRKRGTRSETPEAAGVCSVAVPSEFIRDELNRERMPR